MSGTSFDLYELDAETLDELIEATRRALDRQPDVIREARLNLEAEEAAYDILAGMLEKFKRARNWKENHP